jgi:predicted secreted protein
VTIYTAIVVFTIIWWTVLFAVLPIGIRRNDTPGRGHDAGAPLHPRIMLHLTLTTGISILLFGVAYLIITNDVLVVSR